MNKKVMLTNEEIIECELGIHAALADAASLTPRNLDREASLQKIINYLQSIKD